MSTKKKMGIAVRTVIKGVFGIEPDEMVTDEFQKLVNQWAKRIGHGHRDGTKLQYDDINDQWVTVTGKLPYHGVVTNEIFVPSGPLDAVDIGKAVSEMQEVQKEDLQNSDGSVKYYCGCNNPRCDLPNGPSCMNPI